MGLKVRFARRLARIVEKSVSERTYSVPEGHAGAPALHRDDHLRGHRRERGAELDGVDGIVVVDREPRGLHHIDELQASVLEDAELHDEGRRLVVARPRRVLDARKAPVGLDPAPQAVEIVAELGVARVERDGLAFDATAAPAPGAPGPAASAQRRADVDGRLRGRRRCRRHGGDLGWRAGGGLGRCRRGRCWRLGRRLGDLRRWRCRRGRRRLGDGGRRERWLSLCGRGRWRLRSGRRDSRRWGRDVRQRLLDGRLGRRPGCGCRRRRCHPGCRCRRTWRCRRACDPGSGVACRRRLTEIGKLDHERLAPLGHGPGGRDANHEHQRHGHDVQQERGQEATGRLPPHRVPEEAHPANYRL